MSIIYGDIITICGSVLNQMQMFSISQKKLDFFSNYFNDAIQIKTISNKTTIPIIK